MPFVKGQSGNRNNKEFSDALIAAYVNGDSFETMSSDFNIPPRTIRKYLYNEVKWFNKLSGHVFKDILGQRHQNTIESVSATKDFLKTQEVNRKLFIQKITSPQHYVYLHVDSNGIVFYVGKGIGERSTDTSGRTKAWKRKAQGGYSVKYFATDLTEKEAISIEDRLITNPNADWDLVNVHRSDTKLDYSTIDWSELFYYDESSPSCLRYAKDIGVGAYKDDVAGFINRNGKYARYKVGFRGKEYMVHRIIYQMFYGNITSDMVINHIDTNPMNNLVGNLEMCTVAENNRRTHREVRGELSTTNTSGVNCFRYTINEYGHETCHLFFRDILGRKCSKKFSCNKYGKERATEFALKYLSEILQLINNERTFLEKNYAIL